MVSTLGQAALLGMLLIVCVQRVSELRLARRNLARMLARGAKLIDEPHYWMFFALHGGWLLAWVTEAWLRGPTLAPSWLAWAIGFVLAEALRYWAIFSLGERWNTRIVVLEREPLIRRGPYRYIAHPNYVAVALELACVPMMFGAWWSAGICTILNAALLLGLRIPAELAAMHRSSEPK